MFWVTLSASPRPSSHIARAAASPRTRRTDTQGASCQHPEGNDENARSSRAGRQGHRARVSVRAEWNTTLRDRGYMMSDWSVRTCLGDTEDNLPPFRACDRQVRQSSLSGLPRIPTAICADMYQRTPQGSLKNVLTAHQRGRTARFPDDSNEKVGTFTAPSRGMSL